MSLKSFAARIFASRVVRKQNRWMNDPLEIQLQVFRSLIKTAENTAFGKDHNFHEIRDYTDFASNVPVRDYEKLRAYVDRVVEGEELSLIHISEPTRPPLLSRMPSSA